MIRYLSGKDNRSLEAVAWQYDIGLMIQPNNTYWSRVHAYPMWCADNGCFTRRGCGFNLRDYVRMISQPTLQKYKSRCLFVNAPDDLVVLADGRVIGNAAGTLKLFPMWAAVLHNLGFPVALVAQDGLDTMLDQVPWDDFEVLFVGGSNEFKLGPAAKVCVDEAKRQGKHTHMGRVNSYKRLKLANGWGIDTADGTYLKYGPEKNLPRLLGWLDKLRGKQ